MNFADIEPQRHRDAEVKMTRKINVGLSNEGEGEEHLCQQKFTKFFILSGNLFILLSILEN